MGNTDRARECIEKALDSSPGFEEGRKLYRKLTGREFPRTGPAPAVGRGEAESLRDV